MSVPELTGAAILYIAENELVVFMDCALTLVFWTKDLVGNVLPLLGTDANG